MYILALFLCGFSSALANRSLDPLTSEMARDLSVPVSSVALLASALSFMYAAGQPVIGPAGDHFGKSRILKLSMWLCSASVLASAMAPNFPVLLGIRPITGLAAGGIVPVAMAMIGDHYPPKDRQVAIARFIISAIVGQMAGALFAGSLEASIGWRGVLYLCAGFMFVASLATTLILPAVQVKSQSRFTFAAAKASYRRIFSAPRSYVCFTSSFIMGGLTFGLLPFVAPILEMQKNGGAREAGMIIAGFGCGAFLLALFLPVLLRLLNRPSTMISGSITAACCLIAYSLGAHWSIQIALATAFGFGFFMQHNSIQAEVAELSPEARATAFAMHSSFFFLGHSLGPALYGLQIATLGAPVTLALNGCLIGAAGVSIALYFKRGYARGQQAAQ